MITDPYSFTYLAIIFGIIVITSGYIGHIIGYYQGLEQRSGEFERLLKQVIKRDPDDEIITQERGLQSEPNTPNGGSKP